MIEDSLAGAHKPFLAITINYCRKCAEKQNWKERTIIGMTKE